MSVHLVPNHDRRGVSLLELQVAFVLFGIILSGLVPLTVMQLRQLKKYEERLNPDTTYYLLPASDPWARKLGAAATMLNSAPGPVTPSTGSSVNEITILSLDKSFAGDEVTVQVLITAVP